MYKKLTICFCLSLDDDVPPATVAGSTSASDSLPSAGKCIELSTI